MLTASFSTKGLRWDDPRAVAVCLYPPRGWTGRVYRQLAPPAWLLLRWHEGRVTWLEYETIYTREVLDRLDPVVVAQDLGSDAILCCFEPDGEPCHRHSVARWLGKALGIEIREFRPPDLVRPFGPAQLPLLEGHLL
jgi:hypothetical protein